MNINYLSQRGAALLLVGVAATFLGVQPARAVVSTWESISSSVDSGCDISLIVSGALTAGSAGVVQDQAFADVSVTGGSLILAANGTRGSFTLQVGHPTGDASTIVASSTLTLGKVAMALKLPTNTFTSKSADSSLSIVGGNVVSLSSKPFSNLALSASELSLDDGSDILSGDNGATLEILAVPEPATWAMIMGGMGLLLGVQKMRRNRVA